MASLIAASNHFVFSFPTVGDRPHFPSLAFAFLIHQRRRRPASLGLLIENQSVSSGVSCFESMSLATPVLVFRKSSCSGSVRMCKSWEGEGDSALEDEILNFMQKSDNRDVFPSKKELIDAGRMDLVEAIEKQGGWLTYGWDADDEEETVQRDAFLGSNLVFDKEHDNNFVLGDDRLCQQRIDNISSDEKNSLGDNDVGSSEVSSSSTSSSYPASSSDTPINTKGGEDAGIHGILNRLEKERSLYFGVGAEEKDGSSHLWKKEDRDDFRRETSGDMGTIAGHERRSRSSLRTSKDSFSYDGDIHVENVSYSDFDGIRNSLRPDMWRRWSIRRAGISDDEFEAGEIVPSESRTERITDSMNNEMLASEQEGNEQNQILFRLLKMDSELSSILHLLKSNVVVFSKDNKNSSEDLQMLYDAWEFQETENMNSQAKLRSICAKLTIMEGKMALAITEAQKMAKEKQKRIDDAQHALWLLRTTCVVWPTSASEVLLAGSFDGWSSQRKMKRSSNGIFSLCLKLYPDQVYCGWSVDG
ncbi:PREDICTED: uncharacterized protein LOC104596647 isoform X2 [Nelumbo nucifera]|uniref:Uncharacterized protein LOC104596647 isoform X2 n=1 Tax=Nelumbo nucifera TaxID=4432 RepID=A0A1U7ZVL4_NELNU|nr:PREDICTED: uncharacterized protein LOC104596647 isoform X2 [Nelumbo nucifera]